MKTTEEGNGLAGIVPSSTLSEQAVSTDHCSNPITSNTSLSYTKQ
jgi:hypothetical protein